MGSGNNLIFSNVYFGVDSRVYVIENNDREYIIKAVYKYAENAGEFVENFVAVWTSSQGFSHFSEISAPKNRTDLMGTILRVCYVITNPDTHGHLSDYR